MVEHKNQYRSSDPDAETYDGYDDETRDYPVGSYKFGRSAKDHSVPLFLSDPEGEPEPDEFAIPLRNSRRLSISSKILASVLVAAAVAILFALFSSDDMRNIAINAKASFSAVLPGPSVAAQPDSVQLTAKDIQLKNPARLAAPANMAAVVPPPNVQTPNVQTPGARSGTVVAMAPTREDITTAYQSALQGGRAPAAAAPPAAIAAPAAPVRRLDPDELATLMTRAKGLLAAGDIPPARLLLERAADAQDPTAAFMLAQTYDPAVLGTQDARNIIPDLEVARTWYQRAVQLGSAEAQRRLSQMQ
jgi:TPR repeat protein